MAAAIGWLVQTIFATLKIDKLDAWIRQVGLADDIEKLKAEIWEVKKIVVTAAKGRGIGSELLDGPFALLEERLYEADDVVDELDYYRLQHQVQGVTRGEHEDVLVAERVDDISSGGADTQQSNVGNLRSVVWDHCMITETVVGKRSKAKCNYCRKEFKCDTTTNGTSSMIKHLENEHSVNCKKSPGVHLPNPSSTVEPIASSSRGKGKKRRSKAWDNFEVIENENQQPIKAICKYCHSKIKCGQKTGTAGMLNHNKICKKKPGPVDQTPKSLRSGDTTANVTHIVIGDSSTRKRRRVDESAQITAANKHTPWDKATLFNRIREIISELQDIRGQVREVLKLHGSDLSSSSNHHQSITFDQHLMTSSLVPWKVYGRVAEKNNIIKMITGEKSDGVVVLPIVGIAGVGKTTLTQLVYDDPDVQSKFDHRIWVRVSRHFDEMRLTREMLSFVTQQRHEGLDCFVKLQEILKSHVKSKRILLILDDAWDDKNSCRWNQLRAPFMSDSANGNVILVTTRKLSVAKMVGTTGPIKLGALENEDFWLLFKSCAFGDGNYECLGNLSTIGRQIVDKLKGNPLAAVTTGALLRDHLTVDHWSNILKKENWKSLGLSEGIMPALKLSYDELPYHLQQCYLYCSIFPVNYRFLDKDLVYIWISQGFVNCTHLSKRLEETGWEYLNDLVNLGFFEQVEEQQKDGSQIWYSMCGLMHDFARMLSRTECATIDGPQCNKVLPTIHHLSIVTDTAYKKDQHGNIPRNEKFEENLRNTVTSVGKLRTLVLLGDYDCFFIKLFEDIFWKAHNLRLLQVSTASTDLISFRCGLTNPMHLRYLKLKLYGVVPQDLTESFNLQILDVDPDANTSLPTGLHNSLMCSSANLTHLPYHEQPNKVDGAFPQILSKLYHLQVLDVGSYNDPIPDGHNNLVSLRHLVSENGVYPSIASIGNMTSLQELHDFKVQFCSSGFEITQLQSMNKLVKLGLSQLDNVKTREDANGAGLRNKEHLEELHLSWKETLLENEYVNDTRSESSVNMAREVLEGLEPHMDLKHLYISGYSGTTSPTWLANNISVSSLQTLHLDGCRGWRILPSLGSLPFLTKLKLSSMREVIEVLVPSLEELVLIHMPKLVRCSSTSVEALNSSLRALQIENCEALKEFDLFEKDDNSEIIQGSWLPGLRNLILNYCPHFKVLKPLPPSITFFKLLISGVSTLPYMEGSSSGKLCIGNFHEVDCNGFDGTSDELRILDDKILMFHNLRNLKSMVICGCRNLSSIWFKGFSYLVSLTSLEISWCEKLFSSDEMEEHTHEDVRAENYNAFPSLESLSILYCRTAEKWLCLLLQHAPCLEELVLCSEEDTSSGNLNDGLGRVGSLNIPLNLVSPLKRITIEGCPRLTFNWGKDDVLGFTTLEKLCIRDCPKLLSSLIHTNGRWLLSNSLGELESNGHSQKTLQLCFPSDLTNLKKLEVYHSPGLQSLQLPSCTALEELVIGYCASLSVLEGLQSLGSLRHLRVCKCPGLPPYLESFSRQDYKLCPRLERLDIDDPSVLTTSFCKHLTSLRRLHLSGLEKVKRLTDEQERALVLLKSLQELRFQSCYPLVDLPTELHNVTSLKRLEIRACWGISRLPETGLPLSLELLEINFCSKELADQCRLLATSKLKVIVTRCNS
ncbi:unnamed protein product [Triticum turgidum subsp. durum]|uniref:BED-type domain-containing protein n=1 Tax=Triticum turgidum subsp. durum TaxID=4567 RepID=A0A9R1PYD3_TRITD|nr:unnamed protein product [Triticum turgidum subsp. durum]